MNDQISQERFDRIKGLYREGDKKSRKILEDIIDWCEDEDAPENDPRRIAYEESKGGLYV